MLKERYKTEYNQGVSNLFPDTGHILLTLFLTVTTENERGMLMNHIKIDLERILSDIDRNIFGGYGAIEYFLGFRTIIAVTA